MFPGVSPRASALISEYQHFVSELNSQDQFSACLAAAMRAAGYADVAASSLAAGVASVHTAVQQALHSAQTPFATVSVVSAAVQQMVQLSLVGDECVGSKQEAKDVATAATQMFFGMPSVDAVLVSDPAAFASAAALMAAHGPILDPACMQQLSHLVHAAMSAYPSDVAGLFAAVRKISRTVVDC